MRNGIYVVLMALAVSIVACTKEEGKHPEEDSSGKRIPIEIVGRIVDCRDDSAVETRTSYGEETGEGAVKTMSFSWVQGDEGRILVYNNNTKAVDQEKITALSSGVVTQFSGSITSGYTKTGYAYYPYKFNQKSGTKDAVALKAFKPFTDLSDTPLIGHEASTDEYHFNTACGILGLTLTDIPASVTQVKLISDLVKTPVYNFSGTYTILEDSENDKYYLGTSNVSNGTADVTYNIGSHAEGSSITVYFPVAVGTIARGLSIRLLDSDGNEVSRLPETLSSMDIERNVLYKLPSMAVPRWESIGMGQIDDNFLPTQNIISDVGFSSTEIERCTTDGSRYRLVNPYGAIMTTAGYTGGNTPERYLYFTIKDDGLIRFEPYYTGFMGGEKELVIKHGKYGNWNGQYADNTHSKVLTTNPDGSPSTLQLAPIYWQSTANNGWSRADRDNIVLINMPYVVSVSRVGNASSCTFDFVLGSDVSSVKAWFTSDINDSEPAGATEIMASANGVEVTAPIYSGPYYLKYNVYNSTLECVRTQYFTFNYMKPETASTIATLLPDWTEGYSAQGHPQGNVYVKNNNFYAVKTQPMFQVSDNPTKGNIKLVNFIGMCYDISENELWPLGTDYKDGYPVYGVFDYSSLTVTLDYDRSRPFYTDKNNYPHFLGATTEAYTTAASYSKSIVLSINGSYNYHTYPLVSYYSHVGEQYQAAENSFGVGCRISYLRLGEADTTISE